MFILRSFLVWLLILLAEIIHGVLRGIFLVPVVGDLRARQIGVFSGSMIILAIAVICIRWVRATKPVELIYVGLVWLVLMLGFEISFGRYVMRFSWEKIASDYNLIKGGFLSIGMLVLTASPLIAARIRRLI